MTTILYKNYYPKLITDDRYILASFDLDHTIIVPKSGNVFPKDIDDWKLWNPIVLTKLQELNKDKNNLIVIFSNQKGLKVSKNEFMKKIDNIRKALGINFIFIAALEDDIYRKPRIGMFQELKTLYKFDKNKSFYVGDMAGRKGDKYDTDLKFALNIRKHMKEFTFMTPEEYFFGEKKKKQTLSGYLLDKGTLENNDIPIIPNNNKSMVIISGYPGSGKTTLAKNIINNTYETQFEFISKDMFKGAKIKFNKKLLTTLEDSKNIIVEGLYSTNESRHELKEMAKKYGYHTFYIHVNTSYDTSYHLNLYRSIYEDKDKVPEIVYMKYKKDFENIYDNDWNKVTTYHPTITDDINKYYLF
jgi:bifunctional polynucleotide phosphatase/kinase